MSDPPESDSEWEADPRTELLYAQLLAWQAWGRSMLTGVDKQLPGGWHGDAQTRAILGEVIHGKHK